MYITYPKLFQRFSYGVVVIFSWLFFDWFIYFWFF